MKMKKCPLCNGRGGWYSPDNGQWVTHKDCRGTGEVPDVQSEIDEGKPKPCPECGGNGGYGFYEPGLYNWTCARCRGTGIDP